jgi:hypothetical protein
MWKWVHHFWRTHIGKFAATRKSLYFVQMCALRIGVVDTAGGVGVPPVLVCSMVASRAPSLST